MRKLAIFIAIFCIFLFGVIKSTYADCQTSGAAGCPQAYPNNCGDSRCCQTPQECTGSFPAPIESSVCDSVSDEGGQKDNCNGCMKDNKHVWTALGCISTESPTGPEGIFAKLLSLGMGIAGGVAFLLILFGGLQILTSAGNPEQLNAGRELVSAAIIGLLMVIFSIFLLRFIGIQIIGIPGFAGV